MIADRCMSCTVVT